MASIYMITSSGVCKGETWRETFCFGSLSPEFLHLGFA
jgi:hypothetical protein